MTARECARSVERDEDIAAFAIYVLRIDGGAERSLGPGARAEVGFAVAWQPEARRSSRQGDLKAD